MPKEQTLCLTPKCGKPPAWKGICRSCYGQALRLINDNKTTWDELESFKMINLEDKPFMTQFKKKKGI